MSSMVSTSPATSPATLLVSTTTDPASVVIKEALLRREGWDTIQEDTLWAHQNGSVWLYSITKSHLVADHIDQEFMSLEIPNKPQDITDVMFLSRHAAASGQPSLTVHPIGVPGPLQEVRSGGLSGKCPPPNCRMASTFRELARAVAASPLASEFETALETTHHGPYLDKPACFLEIGSAESHWGRDDAGEIWADVLAVELNLARSETTGTAEEPAKNVSWWELTQEQREKSLVFIGIGGGHYAPRHTDLAKLEGVFIGHLIAGYSLDFGETEAWKHAIVEGVESTKRAFEGCNLSVLMDKKSFKGGQREKVEAFLTEMGLPFAHKKETLYNGR